MSTHIRRTRAERLGKFFSDAIMEAAHLTYNAPRGRKMVQTCIDILTERIEEIQPQKASPEYKQARYGSKT